MFLILSIFWNSYFLPSHYLNTLLIMFVFKPKILLVKHQKLSHVMIKGMHLHTMVTT